MIVSAHAAERWIERVDPSATIPQARSAIQSHSRAIEAAISIGAPVVRLGNGWKLVVREDVVVTVIGRFSMGPNGEAQHG